MVKFSAVVISSQYNLHKFLVFCELDLRIDSVSGQRMMGMETWRLSFDSCYQSSAKLFDQTQVSGQ